jgi:hypothetical protein
VPSNTRAQGGRVFPFWLDLDRTTDLLENHYIYRGITERTFWPDLSTNGIPLQYYQAYVALATAQLVMGQQELSDRNLERAREFLVVALGEEFLVPLQPRDQTQPAQTGPAPDETVGSEGS